MEGGVIASEHSRGTLLGRRDRDSPGGRVALSRGLAHRETLVDARRILPGEKSRQDKTDEFEEEGKCLRKRVREPRRDTVLNLGSFAPKSITFPSFGSKFDGSGPQESLDLSHPTHSELTEKMKRV
ncbi:hypothetical protein G7Z17_g10887 [Cylindrodendrum hubeiense]|uniref:Uncharacterized protein n=1 Tax=Cylindrodendrum hubeiense TaxID=595255 RepID=A0A9P5H0M5_9HYPO|nr:hypothetical protein G7Z17_g10887 [Cylindrodendrum hubeiense]